MYKIAICDDEKTYRSRLRDLLEKYARAHGQSFEIYSFESADKLLLNYPKDLDLLFLDIAMDGVDGISAAREIRRGDPQVCIIFITSMYQYALEGYSVKAFGFITKPVKDAELSHELSCALAMISATREREKFISFKSGGVLYRLPISHISCCEVKDHQIQIHADGETYSYRDQISDLEARLTPLGFFRCHSSYLVNVEHIERIEQTRLKLRDGAVIPISQRRRREFMQEISRFLGGVI